MNRCEECSCQDSFNEHGYCRECGHFESTAATAEPRTVQPFHLHYLNGEWPSNTWLKRRRLELALKALRQIQ